jgi:hypothetical protein
MVIGAVLVLALDVQAAWLDLDALGGILFGAGIVVFIFGIIAMVRTKPIE